MTIDPLVLVPTKEECLQSKRRAINFKKIRKKLNSMTTLDFSN